jgi:SCP-2 sterol transfer family
VSLAPSSPREFFEDFLPAWFSKSAPSSASSPGALVFHVGAETYALRLDAGRLLVTLGSTTDAILQVSVSAADFAELIVQAQPLLDAGQSDRLLALRSLSLDAERAKMIRSVDGSVAFEIADGSEARTLLLTPGIAIVGSAPPACSVRVAASDFWALSRGEKNPFELLMDGKIRMQGRMEVAMALSSVLVG